MTQLRLFDPPPPAAPTWVAPLPWWARDLDRPRPVRDVKVRGEWL